MVICGLAVQRKSNEKAYYSLLILAYHVKANQGSSSKAGGVIGWLDGGGHYKGRGWFHMGIRKPLSPVKFFMLFEAKGCQSQADLQKARSPERILTSGMGGASRWGTPAPRSPISEQNSLVASKDATPLAPQMQP